MKHDMEKVREAGEGIIDAVAKMVRASYSRQPDEGSVERFNSLTTLDLIRFGAANRSLGILNDIAMEIATSREDFPKVATEVVVDSLTEILRKGSKTGEATL